MASAYFAENRGPRQQPTWPRTDAERKEYLDRLFSYANFGDVRPSETRQHPVRPPLAEAEFSGGASVDGVAAVFSPARSRNVGTAIAPSAVSHAHVAAIEHEGFLQDFFNALMHKLSDLVEQFTPKSKTPAEPKS